MAAGGSSGLIMFAGDPHGDFGAIEAACLCFMPKVLVLLGDLTPSVGLSEALSFALDRGVGVFWIPGNHDADDAETFERTFGSNLAPCNISGRVIEALGVRIAGLGGKFHKNVWLPPNPPKFLNREGFLLEAGEGLRPFSLVTIFNEDIQSLKSQHSDILVSHVAPSTHPHGFAVLDDLASSMGARLIIHAHHHRARYLACLKGGTLVCGIGSGLALLDRAKGAIRLFASKDQEGEVCLEIGKEGERKTHGIKEEPKA